MTRSLDPTIVTGAQCGDCGEWVADCETLNDADSCRRCVSEAEEEAESDREGVS